MADFFKTDRITWDVPAADDFFKSASESMKMRHLPEYDHVIAWMQSNKGRGLLIIGSNGRGKTMIAKKHSAVILRLCDGQDRAVLPCNGD